jgi:hypothetical protein
MKSRAYNIGFDVHGVIDKYPDLFKEIIDNFISEGHAIHILTGQEWEAAEPQIKNYGIRCHAYFSIIDFHRKKGTNIYQRSDKAGWWMADEVWNRSKGDYAEENELDLHFDDQLNYAEYFPNTCTFIYVPSLGFENVYKEILNLKIQKRA